MQYNQQTVTENGQSRPQQTRTSRLQGQQSYRRQQSSSSMTSTSRDVNSNVRGPREHGSAPRSLSKNRTAGRMQPISGNLPGKKGPFVYQQPPQLHQHQHPPQQASFQYPGLMQPPNHRQTLHSTIDHAAFSVPPPGFPMQPSDPRSQRWGKETDFSKRSKIRASSHDKRNRPEDGLERVQLTVDYGGKKAHQHPEFAIPKSSLDNLLGIDAMEMCHAAPIGPRHIHRPMMRGLVGRPTEEHDKSETAMSVLTPFQQSCIRSLASMSVCPHTILPITVGMFTRSFMMEENIFLQALSEEISNRMASNPLYQRNNRIEFTMCTSLLPLFVSILIGYILGLALGWQLGIAVAVTALIIYIITVCIIVVGIGAKRSTKSARFAETVSRYMRGCNLILNILFYRAPPSPSVAQPVRLLPISLNLAGCVSGVDAAALMTEKMWQFIEQKYGKIAVRMQWASKDAFGESTQTFRKFCCLPLWFWLSSTLLTSLTLATLMAFAPPSVIDMGSVQAPGVTKATSTDLDTDSHVQAGRIHNAAIVCAIFSALSFLVLCAASVPSLINLIQGRPFQRKHQRLCYKAGGKLGEPPMDMCYGMTGGRFDPMACVRMDGQCNARYASNPSRAAFHLNQELTSAATVAAAAAAAAVTAAADQKWRLFSHSHNRTNGSSGGGKGRADKPRLDITDVESQASQSATSDDDVDDGSESSEKGDDSSDIQTQFQNNVNLCESGELLLKGDQKRKKANAASNHRQGCDKKSMKSTAEAQQNLSRWKQLIRRGLMEACKVLSMIDSRIGKRQTRIVLCITGTGCPTSPTSTIIKLATFVRLVDRLLMQPPEGGTSGDVTVMLEPSTKKHTSGKPEGKPTSASRLWTPNVIVLVAASVPSSLNPTANPPPLKSQHFAREPPSALMGQHPSTWANFKLWWSVHHFCHLPLYLEDEPIGARINRPISPHQLPSITSPSMFPLQTTQYLPTNSTLLDVYAGIHELADLNTKYLRQLLTMSAFMGRMINIERLSVEQQGMIRIPAHALPGSANYLPTLAVLVTWLCLIQHWPFHAAWLALFIEEHFRSEMEQDGLSRSHDAMAFSQSRGRVTEETPANGQRTPQSEPLHWNSDLAQLHNRVLRRLAPAVETARQKALSASIGTMHSGMDFPNRHLPTYPPHVMSTLDICDLALRDRDPRRLARFLRSTATEMNTSQEVTDPTTVATAGLSSLFAAGYTTVGQLLRVMKLTPFLNPQISQWIKDVLLTKVNMSESMVEEKSGGATPAEVRSQSLDSSKRISSGQQPKLDEVKRCHPSTTTTSTAPACRVKLKHGLPKKQLHQMTIDDICNLLKDIEDLSANQTSAKSRSRYKPGMSKERSNSRAHQSDRKARTSSSDSETPVNDPAPPAPTTTRASRAVVERVKNMPIGKYEDRIRRMNLTGNVLTICSMGELQKELGMSFGDWKLFSTVIGYLRSREASSTGDQHGTTLVQGQSGSAYLYHPQEFDQSVTSRERQNIISTVSDTSIALTVKSAPLSEEAHPVNSATPKPAKSMLSLTSTRPVAYSHRSSAPYRVGSVERPFDKMAPTAQHHFCRRHSLKALARQKQQQQNVAAALRELPTAAFCPRHQEQVRRLVHQVTHHEGYTDERASREPGRRQLDGLCEHLGHRSLPRVHTCGYHKEKRSSDGLMRSEQIASTSLEQLSRAGPLNVSGNRGIHGNEMQPTTSQRTSTQLERKHPIHRPGLVGHVGSSTCGRGNQETKSAFQKQAIYSRGDYDSTGANRSSGHQKHTGQDRLPTLVNGIYKVPHSVNAHILPAERNLEGHETIPRDSASTSLAGEMAEEVAEISPTHANNHVHSAHQHQDGVDGSDSQSAHSCDCNYWYSLEAAAATVPIELRRQSNQIVPPNAISPCTKCNSPTDNSISDSLSTTRSQLDVSSGTTSGCTSTGTSLERVDQMAS